jgi:predicted ester cyclase
MSTTTASSNKATLRRFHDAFGTGDAEIISAAIDEVLVPDALIHTPFPIETTGAQAVKDVLTAVRRAFPDLHITIEDVIAEGDRVVCRTTATGTHLGEYLGLAPTGRTITYNEMLIARRTGRRNLGARRRLLTDEATRNGLGSAEYRFRGRLRGAGPARPVTPSPPRSW